MQDLHLAKHPVILNLSMEQRTLAVHADGVVYP
jgi:hypothetical protein